MSIRPRTRSRVRVVVDSIKFIQSRTTLTKAQVITLVNQILTEALKRTLIDIRNEIGEGKRRGSGATGSRVAKATGQLRDSLHDNLDSSAVTKQGLKLVIGTHLDYGKWVNAMSTGNVRHSGQVRNIGSGYYGERGNITLNDNKAVGGFMGKLRLIAKASLKKHMTNVLQSSVRAMGQPTKPFTDKLKVIGS